MKCPNCGKRIVQIDQKKISETEKLRVYCCKNCKKCTKTLEYVITELLAYSAENAKK